jgi:hypothetical protein
MTFSTDPPQDMLVPLHCAATAVQTAVPVSDRTTCRQNLVPTFVDRGMSRGQRGESPTVTQFPRPEPLVFFQVAPQLSSQGLSGPRSRPTATQKIW